MPLVSGVLKKERIISINNIGHIYHPKIFWVKNGIVLHNIKPYKVCVRLNKTLIVASYKEHSGLFKFIRSEKAPLCFYGTV